MKEAIIETEIAKSEWILLYGSKELQYVSQAGYKCDRQYLKERLKAEYPGFKFYSEKFLEELDRPSINAIKQSHRWESAIVMRSFAHRELIVITNYLDEYTIVQATKRTKLRLLFELALIIGFSIFVSLIATIAYFGWQTSPEIMFSVILLFPLLKLFLLIHEYR